MTEPEGPAPPPEPGPEPEGETEPLPPPPSPFARLPTRSTRLVPEAFDVLTRSTGDLRRASFYIGFLVAGTVAPFALLLWRVNVDIVKLPIDEQIDLLTRGGLEAAMNVSLVIALVGVVVASIESRAIAAALIAARLEGNPLPLRSAVERSRRVFWRIVRATIITTVPLYLVQLVTERLAAGVFRGESEASVVSSALVTTVLLAPFAYVLAGVVLGDVGALEAVRRSVRLFKVRKVAALVVALFAWSAQLLTGFGIGAGLDLVLRAGDLTSLFSSTDAAGTAVTAVVLMALLFALGTLLFTVTAISLAPQVVMFLALTHVAPGLDAARMAPSAGTPRFRWLTRPYIVLVIVAAGVLGIGLTTLSG